MSAYGSAHRNERDQYIAAAAAGQQITCWLCGDPIRMDLPSEDRYAFQLDHVKPVSVYPELAHDPANLRPSHRLCNRIKGAGKHKPGITHNSRQWD